MNLLKFVASRIRELRTSYGSTGLSQEALASALGVATNTISRWETGAYRPSIEDLEKLARFFRISVQEFFPVEAIQPNEQLTQLLRAAEGLDSVDLEELRRYAEFRRARHKLEQSTKRSRKPGAKEP
jgi:transcriptional regulator with XRE-family HTH domain